MYFAKNVNFQFPMCAFLSLFSVYTHSYLSNCIFGRQSLQSLFVSEMYPEVCIYKYFFLQYVDELLSFLFKLFTCSIILQLYCICQTDESRYIVGPWYIVGIASEYIGSDILTASQYCRTPSMHHKLLMPLFDFPPTDTLCIHESKPYRISPFFMR